MFTPNKYTRWYMKIVGRATKRTLKGYSEKHHIIPKSLGGSNTKDNLVSLTAREHFICHWLLIKMTSGSAKRKMSYALWTMTRENDRVNRKLNSSQYETARKHFSVAHKGNKKTPEGRARISAALKGSKRPWAAETLKTFRYYKQWEVEHPDGKIEKIIGLAKFCKEHNLHQGNMSFYGHSKGYKVKKIEGNVVIKNHLSPPSNSLVCDS